MRLGKGEDRQGKGSDCVHRSHGSRGRGVVGGRVRQGERGGRGRGQAGGGVSPEEGSGKGRGEASGKLSWEGQSREGPEREKPGVLVYYRKLGKQ